MSGVFVNVSLDDQSLANTLSALDRFGRKAERVVKSVVNKTALAVETDAKNKLKSDGHIITNRLRASIHAETKPNQNFVYSTKSGGTFDGSLKTDFGDLEAIAGTNVDYAGAIEFGSAPHVIKPKNRKVLSFLIGKERVFSKQVNHPGFKGDSFMRHASEKQKQPFVKRMIEGLNKLIKEESK